MIATMTSSLPTEVSPLASDLLLVRLLSAGQKPTLSQIRPSLTKFFHTPPTGEQWQELADHLRSEGFLEPKGLRLTDQGRARACRFLGIEELPTRITWLALQSRYLVPQALGLDHSALQTREKIRTADGLAALLLRRKFSLPVETGGTLKMVLEALVCRELGVPEATSLKEARDIILGRMIGATERLTTEQMEKNVPTVLLKTPRATMAALRDSVLLGWADHGSATEHRTEEAPVGPSVTEIELDLAMFANTVKSVARDCPPEARFGDDKVFIHRLWERLREEPTFSQLDLPEFKRLLVKANRARYLNLARADLLQAMNPADVAASSTCEDGSEFHFLSLDKEQP